MNHIEPLLRSYRAPNMFNPWGESDPNMDLYRDAHELRWRALLAHFNCHPRYLLIGEAPGYQGCRYSGVPFTSERLICDGDIPRMQYATVRHSDHSFARITRRPLPWSEPSATIVWDVLHQLGIAEHTVMWNAFPWHPYKPGLPLSNRTPVVCTDALLILEAFIRMFPSATVVSVGKVAQQSCELVTDRTVHRVRHPANGGASLFRNQLKEIVTNVQT